MASTAAAPALVLWERRGPLHRRNDTMGGQHIGVRVCRMMYRQPSESDLLPLQVADLRGPQTVAITNLIFVLPPNRLCEPPGRGDFWILKLLKGSSPDPGVLFHSWSR
jgi:hypothetical protein